MSSVRPTNRPPAFNLESISPSAPIVTINTACRDERHRTEFWAEVLELDVDQDLTALWFWNYDAGALHHQQIRLLYDVKVPKTGTIYRSLPSYHLPAPVPDPDLDTPGANTIEVFVVETAALVPGTGAAPFYRNLRDCRAEGYPDDCVSTHPALMRWTVYNMRDEGLCQ